MEASRSSQEAAEAARLAAEAAAAVSTDDEGAVGGALAHAHAVDAAGDDFRTPAPTSEVPSLLARDAPRSDLEAILDEPSVAAHVHDLYQRRHAVAVRGLKRLEQAKRAHGRSVRECTQVAEELSRRRRAALENLEAHKTALLAELERRADEARTDIEASYRRAAEPLARLSRTSADGLARVEEADRALRGRLSDASSEASLLRGFNELMEEVELALERAPVTPSFQGAANALAASAASGLPNDESEAICDPTEAASAFTSLALSTSFASERAARSKDAARRRARAHTAYSSVGALVPFSAPTSDITDSLLAAQAEATAADLRRRSAERAAVSASKMLRRMARDSVVKPSRKVKSAEKVAVDSVKKEMADITSWLKQHPPPKF